MATLRSRAERRKKPDTDSQAYEEFIEKGAAASTADKKKKPATSKKTPAASKQEQETTKPAAPEVEESKDEGEQVPKMFNPFQSSGVTVPQYRRRRNAQKYTGSYPLRTNDHQEALVQYARTANGGQLTKAQVYEELIWPVLEEKYGEHVPFE